VNESRAPDTHLPGIDASRPNIARVYDYLLGGTDNFTADRELAGQLLIVNPGMEQWARDNRTFVVAAAARAAREGGIAQFLDLGAGLPTHPAVHEAVREVNPAARVAYVDFDPIAVVHSRALLAKGDGLAAFQADLTDPEAVLTDPDLVSRCEDIFSMGGRARRGTVLLWPRSVMHLGKWEGRKQFTRIYTEDG